MTAHLTPEEEKELLELRDRLLHKLAPVLEELPALRRFADRMPAARRWMTIVRLLSISLAAPKGMPETISEGGRY